jgi:PAP2 superfamily
MTASPNRNLQVALSLPIAACACAVVLYPQSYVLLRVSPFVWLTLASTLILHLRVRPKWSEGLLLVVTAATLSGLSFLVNPYPYDPITGIALLGVASLAILGLRAVWSDGEERKLFIWAFIPGILFVASGWLTPPILVWGERIRPKVLDLYLYFFDGSLRVQLSFLVGMAFKKWAWLRAISVSYYLGLPILLATVYAAHLTKARQRAFQALLGFLCCGPIGELFYNFFPALGPIRLFHQDFPFHPISTAQTMHLFLEPVAIAGPRNAIPSLHMAWVLLAWWYSEATSRIVRGIVLSFVVFTVLATLGTGEHYFVDLVVAFPFTLFLLALFSFSIPWNDVRRFGPLLTGLAGTLVWFAILRFGTSFIWVSPLIPWGLVLVTLVGVIFQRRRLFAEANWRDAGSPATATFSKTWGATPVSESPQGPSN